MLQIGAKVVDAVRMGPKPVQKAKAAAPAPGPPRDGTQSLKQPMQEMKSVPEQRYPNILYINGSITLHNICFRAHERPEALHSRLNTRCAWIG